MGLGWLEGRAAGQLGTWAAGRQGGRAAGRQGGRAAGRQGGRAAGRQGGRAAGRQGGRAAALRLGLIHRLRWCQLKMAYERAHGQGLGVHAGGLSSQIRVALLAEQQPGSVNVAESAAGVCTSAAKRLHSSAAVCRDCLLCNTCCAAACGRAADILVIGGL
jgi:hypothetical protein